MIEPLTRRADLGLIDVAPLAGTCSSSRECHAAERHGGGEHAAARRTVHVIAGTPRVCYFGV